MNQEHRPANCGAMFFFRFNIAPWR